MPPAASTGRPGTGRLAPGVGSGVVSDRELVVLGTASQAPTRRRNHNGYLLRWDDEGLLFDPGEGTQRQMMKYGVGFAVNDIFFTHLHVTEGDLKLFAFDNESERDLFKLLQSVTGVGPSLALALISGAGAGSLVRAVSEKDLAGADERKVAPPWLEGRWLRGRDYLVDLAIPNFFFHVTMAYAILRHNGVNLGKMDYIGSLPTRDA